MKKYRVYLTKSAEVAALISRAYVLREDNVCTISHGAVDINNAIPDIYKGKGYFQRTITYNESAPVKDYELIIA